jgi:hypothetical protein
MQALSRMIRFAPDIGPQRVIRFIRLLADKGQRSKKPNRLLAVFLIAALVWLPAGCSTQNPEAPATNQPHSGRYVNPAYSASTAFHGTEVNAAGTDDCISCHGRDLAGTDTVPGCTDCHFDAWGSRVPPGSGWIHGSDQHLDYADVQEVCNRCHDTFRRFDMPPAYCHNCHGPGINHVLGRPWLDRSSADFHGSADLTDCSSCHYLDTDCSQCHFGPDGSMSPPGSNWKHGNNDEHRSFEAYRGICNQCHIVNRSYGNPPPDCHDCHED